MNIPVALLSLSKRTTTTKDITKYFFYVYINRTTCSSPCKWSLLLMSKCLWATVFAYMIILSTFITRKNIVGFVYFFKQFLITALVRMMFHSQFSISFLYSRRFCVFAYAECFVVIFARIHMLYLIITYFYRKV